MENGDYLGKWHAWKHYNEEYGYYEIVYTLTGKPSTGDGYSFGSRYRDQYVYGNSAFTATGTIDSVRTEKPVVNYSKKVFVTVRTELIENGEYVLADVTEYHSPAVSFRTLMGPAFAISGETGLGVEFYLGATVQEDDQGDYINKFMHGSSGGSLSIENMIVIKPGIYDPENETFLEAARGKVILIRVNKAKA